MTQTGPFPQGAITSVSGRAFALRVTTSTPIGSFRLFPEVRQF